MSFTFLTSTLDERRQNNQFRRRHCVETIDEQLISVNNKQYVNFSSNDYLGLNNHPSINQALCDGAKQFGASSCSSSLVTGYSYAHQALENEICLWQNKERCLLFSSGFAANLGTLQALKYAGTKLYLDKLSHASLIDGARLDSVANQNPVKRFKHNDSSHLNKLLQVELDNQLVVTESVFSMDGDCAALPEIKQLSAKYNAMLYVDDAHGLGVLGQQGEGGASLCQSDITMGTFGKAVATQGAFIGCDKNLFDYLVNFSREYIYSTAISPAVAWSTLTSIKLIQKEHWRREKVQELSQLFKSKLDSSITLLPNDSSIHAIVIGDEDKALSVSETLRKEGFWVSAIRPPTVPKGTSRLRVTICQNHNAKDIIGLAENINKAMV